MLTISTVLPQLQVLVQMRELKRIYLVTLEEDASQANLYSLHHTVLSHEKVTFAPIVYCHSSIKVVSQITDFSLVPSKVARFVKMHGITIILSHGSPAGALAYLVWKKTGIQFYVSSFEPHADYMAESGVWSRLGLKYCFQKYWEHQQKLYATGLMPVAENYRHKLTAEGVNADRIKVVPSPVDAAVFQFDAEARVRIREQLLFQNCTIGVYTGKFGDIYYDDEAFKIFDEFFKVISNFRLIILSPQKIDFINGLLAKANLNAKKVFIASVPHDAIPQYLSASDLAFAPIKPSPYSIYCSPVKIGEYWASGLPVLLTEGIGDDSDIIKNEGGGALFNLAVPGSVEKAILQIQEIIKQPGYREQIRKLAIKYRSPDRIREAYDYFLGEKLHG